MSRILVFWAVSAFLFLAPAAQADILPVNEALAERSIGAADAPVTIYEYSSLGCPHCASFHRDTLPQIKKDYIDTGKIRLVLIDFPLGGRALTAALVARCAPKDAHHGLIELFFREQARWAEAKDPMVEIERIARFARLSPADIKACLANQELLKGVTGRAKEASEKLNIRSTPTFIIEGSRIDGAQPYVAFKKAIDDALRKKK